jgi:hypothetical protein
MKWKFQDRGPLLVLLKAFPTQYQGNITDENIAEFESDTKKLVAHYKKHGFTQVDKESPYMWLDLSVS